MLTALCIKCLFILFYFLKLFIFISFFDCVSTVCFITIKCYSVGRVKVSSTLLCQSIEPAMFARCVFIFALQNIALGGYLDIRRNT